MDSKPKKTILIVDDVPINRTVLGAIFRDEYNMIEAGNGQLAISALKEHPEIFVVVLDLVMPVMDGYSVLKEMSATEGLKDIPVIVVTANDDEENQITALELGAIDVISKPYSKQIVKARIKNAVERRSAQLKAIETQLLEFKLAQQQSELKKSRTDALTGLYSKQYFFSEIERTLKDYPNREYVLGIFDIDRFKVFNDTFDFKTGDNLLSDIGRMIMSLDDHHLFASRIEADHFAALFEKRKLDAIACAENIQKWFNHYPVGFDFTAKFGFYEIDDNHLDPSIIYDRAYLALKSVKDEAGMQIGYYDSSLRQTLIDEQELQAEINVAFDKEQFCVWFQPQYDYSSGKMSGAEALVRWVHPVRGIIPAYKFISLMEKNGSIKKLDEYVWERCCIHLRNWLDARPEDCRLNPLPISTNISRADLLRSDLADIFENLTDKYRIPRELLNLEITESAYMDDSDRLLTTVEKLRSLGFTLEMDDFGAGYSSLNTLKDVPVDILKLDMKFISGAQNSPRGGSILSSVVRMARWLRMPVIAEGVETKEQADFLCSIGCRYMQGFYFAKPMSEDNFRRLYWDDECSPIALKQHAVDLKSVEPFLNATSQTTLLFNSFLGGAAICEYDGENLEVLRANQRFFSILHTTQESFEPWSKQFQNRFSENSRRQILDALNRLTDKSQETDIECESSFSANGKHVWTMLRIKLLAVSESTSVFYVGTDDITERVHAETELRKQDTVLNSLYQAVPGGILHFQIQDGGKRLKLLSYNTAVWEILRFKSEKDFLNSTTYSDPFSNIYPDDKSRFEEHLNAVMHGLSDPQEDFEHRVITADGGICWVHSVIQLIDANTGEKYVQCVFNDITEHREIRTQRYGRSLLKFFTEVIEVDFERMTYTQIDGGNNETFDMKGEAFLDRLMIDRVNNVVHPDDRKALVSIFRKINNHHSDTDINLPQLEYRVLGENGKTLWHSLFLMYVGAMRYLCCISDITYKKENENLTVETIRLIEQLRAKEADEKRNAFLMNAFGFTVLNYDVANDVLEFTGHADGAPVATRINGFSEGTNHLNQLMHPDDIGAFAAKYRQAAKLPRSGDFDFRQKCKDGYHWFRLRYVSFEDDYKKIYRVFGVAIDVQHEYDSKKLVSQLSGKDVGEYNTVSHELFKILATTKEADLSIEKALAVVGNYLGISRAYVIENSADGKRFSTTFEWHAANVSARKADEADYPAGCSAKKYEKLFNKAGSLVCNDINTLKDELRFAISTQHVKSFAQWGIWQDGTFVGYVGFDVCDTQREWTKSALSLLSLISSYISVLLGKIRN